MPVALRVVAIAIYILATPCIYYVGCQDTIIFSAISNFDQGTSGKSIVGAQWLAIQEINNNPNLLSAFQLQLESL